MTEPTTLESAASFLAAEREAWRPYEALMTLDDATLDRACEGAHGWSGRELVAHLVGWHEVTVTVARELAAGESHTLDRYYGLSDPEVDELNAAMIAAWRTLPMAEVRRRFVAIPAELRTVLGAGPEQHWLNDEHGHEWMLWNTFEHYEGHARDLAAILEEARR